MFRRRPDGRPAAVELAVEDRRVAVPEGASAAAAVLLAGFRDIRETPVGGAKRGPYCLMGVCFECLAEIDGEPNRQSCMVAARPGMRIRRQRRARRVEPLAAACASRPLLNPPPPRGEGDLGASISGRRPPSGPSLQAEEGLSAPPGGETGGHGIGHAANVDLAVVGGGPAGIAAAVLGAEVGLETVLIDEQDALGGQIYRGVERAAPGSPLGADYLAGQRLVAALRASGARRLPATTLWHLDPDGILYLSRDGRTGTVAARAVLLATGAIERPVPIRGWTLPGVMTAGGAQTLLKSADMVPEGRVVLAGQGPLLYLVAAQLARAGAPPVALLETTPFENYRAAVVDAWRGRHLLWQGWRLMREVRRAGIPVRRGVRGLRAHGDGRLERVAWDGGEIAADHLLLHEGVIPNVQVSLALQLRHEWDAAQACWRPAVDEWGWTSLPGILVAGDSAGIAGATAAALSGRLAALAAAARLGHIDEFERDRRAVRLRRALDRERGARPFLDRLYRPAAATLAPPEDAVVVCRCEEVTGGQIRAAARLGATGPNQLKAFTRCGMGPCQGRICGPVVAALIAETLSRPIAEIGTYRPRAPFKPVTLGALADLEALPDHSPESVEP